MTENKGKRRFWRRGPRRRKADAGAGEPLEGETARGPEEGTGASDAPAPEAGGAPQDRPGTPGSAGDDIPFAPGDAGTGGPGPVGDRADAGPERPEAGQETGEAPRAPGGDDNGHPGKRSRRRGRRRGRRGAQGAAAQADGEPPADEQGEPDAGREAGTRGPQAGPPAVESVPGEGNGEEGEGTEPPDRGGEPGEAGAQPRKGRRRSRRRGRRRGGRPGDDAAPKPESADGGGAVAAPAEAFAGPEEPHPDEAYAEPAGAEAAEPAGEEEAAEDEEAPPGKGPRKVMLIDGVHPEEVRVAIVSDGNLDYFEVENRRKKAFKGNIYKGKVVNIAHAIEAAFVEFGGGRHGFLPLNEYCGGALMESLGTWTEGDKRPHLRPGMEILVQVTKEESPIKGAALTSYISIAGRYLVMMLGMKRYGISKKITGEKEREKIRKSMEKLEYPEHLGFIVRTVGAGQPLKNLKADLQNLLKLWDRTVEEATRQKAPALLYEEQDIVIRALRDNYAADFAEVLMDSPDSYRKASEFFDVYYPKQKSRLKLIRQKRPLFSKFNLEEQLDRGTARKVPLPSGGHIVIDRTEALWSIDVNSGRSSKDRDIEDTAFRTNKEAAAEVTRQLRIRDMGGLIVVDFIDMENRNHIKDVEKTLKDGMKKDKAKSDISGMGKFGLVAISRQRMGISFYDVLQKACEACGGTGQQPTSDASVARLLRRVHDELSREPGREVVVRVSPALLEGLLNLKREEITRLEKLCGSHVVFSADPSLSGASYTVGGATA